MKRYGIWVSILLLAGVILSGCAAPVVAVAVEPVVEEETAGEPETGAEEIVGVDQAAAEVVQEVAETEVEEAPVEEIAEYNEMVYPENWEDMPVIPVVSDKMRAVYEQGLALGNDPHAFSIIGDCQNVSDYFMADYAQANGYRLGEYTQLQETIDYFDGSFAGERAAVQGGYNVASVLSPMWADQELCEERESPLACEYRLNTPSFALISMETWWFDRPADTYANYLAQIVEYSLEQGVIPILATKADNLEEDHRINKAIVRVAQEYDVPLWNFWLAVQPLPGHGLTEDGFHLTYARPFFDDPETMKNGWPVRNLTALQALDAVWRAVDNEAE